MKTEKGFVVGFSKMKPTDDFCWFIRHKDINNGIPIPVNRGSLEHKMTMLRKKIMKL